MALLKTTRWLSIRFEINIQNCLLLDLASPPSPHLTASHQGHTCCPFTGSSLRIAHVSLWLIPSPRQVTAQISPPPGSLP